MSDPQRLRRLHNAFLALVVGLISLIPPVEGGSLSSRRAKYVCGAALLGVSATAGTFWFGEAPNGTLGPSQAGIHPPMETQSAADSAFHHYQFNQGSLSYTEVEILNDSWLSKQVAERVKAKLVGEFPQAAELPRWGDPGLRVPLAVVTFVVDPLDARQVHVQLVGPFLTLKSEQTLSLEQLHSGAQQKVQFKHRRTDAFNQGLELSFDFSFRFDTDDQAVDDVQMSGKLRAFGPFFEHEGAFATGPLTARAATRVAER